MTLTLNEYLSFRHRRAASRVTRRFKPKPKFINKHPDFFQSNGRCKSKGEFINKHPDFLQSNDCTGTSRLSRQYLLGSGRRFFSLLSSRKFFILITSRELFNPLPNTKDLSMYVYPAAQAKIKLLNPQDPDALSSYGFKYKSEIWQALKVYEEAIHSVRPPIHNGFEYFVVSNGLSGADEPAWATVAGGRFQDGSVTLEARHYNSFLRPDETLEAITGSTWTTTDAVPVVSEGFTLEGEATVRVGPVPDGVTFFELTNHVISSAGDKDDKTFIIIVRER